MKKVLIICDLFPPAFAPRMGYLCKYLPAYGWEPAVLAETVDDEHAFAFLKGSVPVTSVNFYTARGKYARKLQWLLTFLLDSFFGYKDRCIYKEAKRLLREQSFDVILCSTFRTFPLTAARRTARKHKIPLVVDLRDIIEQYAGNEYIAHPIPLAGSAGKALAALFKRKSLRDRNRVLRQADYVTTVSPWHVKTLKQFNPRVKLIYNGYDPELFYPEQLPTAQFIITYTGRLLSTAMRNPELLFKALHNLHEEGVLSPADCQVHWYVDDVSQKAIRWEAEREQVLPFMCFKGYVPAAQIPHILNNSSVLLLLTNQSSGDGPKGVMTTKFFEALAVEKPILCVRSDESHLAAAIKETRAGLAAVTVKEVCDFLKHRYSEWKAKGYTAVAVDKEALRRYSRKEQAGQFAAILDKCVLLRCHSMH
ncbi:hypothetical protein Barb6XT_01568 [Bacteroidales bacterium Barb6XT]|nr:hypothetical protein Barb6XT_01568 [Bacteroidales bacterium Barb6XT]